MFISILLLMTDYSQKLNRLALRSLVKRIEHKFGMSTFGI